MNKINIFPPIKDHKGFVVTETQYIEPTHPQYNYLGFRAENDIGHYIEIIFHDIDLRIKSHDELLSIFLRRLDEFIEENGLY